MLHNWDKHPPAWSGFVIYSLMNTTFKVLNLCDLLAWKKLNFEQQVYISVNIVNVLELETLMINN